MSEYKCSLCSKEFKSYVALNYHNNNKVCVEKIHNRAKDSIENKCKYCNKGFTSATNMYRHVRHACKVKKTDVQNKEEILDVLVKGKEETDQLIKELKEANEKLKKTFDEEVIVLKKENKELKKEMVQLKKSSIKSIKTINTDNSIHNNNTNNGTVNNIILVGYGKEDMSKIDQKEILKALQDGFFSSVSLTKSIHFNPKHPENHNVFISNIKNRYAMMYVDGKWILTTKEELINKIYEDKKSYIEENFDKFLESLLPSRKRALQTWLEMDDEDQKVKDIKENLKLLLYNSRNVINDNSKISLTLMPKTSLKSLKVKNN